MSVSRRWWVIGLCASLGIHLGAVALTLEAEPEVQVAGGGEVRAPVLGTSGSDTIRAGTVAAELPIEPMSVQRTQPVQQSQAATVSAAKPAPANPIAPVPPLKLEHSSRGLAVRATSPDAPLEPVVRQLETAAPATSVASKSPAAPKSEPLAPDRTKAVPDTPQAQIAPLAPEPGENIAQAKPVTGKDTVEPVQQLAPKQVADLTAPAVPVPRTRPADRPLKKTADKPTQEAAEKARQRTADAKGEANGAGGRSGRTAQKGGSQRAGSGKTAGNSDVTNYPAKVQRKLNRSIRSPRAGRRGQKNVLVSFTVAASGAVSSIQISRSSGSPAHDKAALSSVKRAAPFPKIPAAAGRSSWTFTLPIMFR